VTAKPAPTALITGIAGQDGSYLAELLLGRGYRVVGICKPTSSMHRITHILGRIEVRSIDLLDDAEIANLLNSARPQEVYNLAGHSFVPTSLSQPWMMASSSSSEATSSVRWMTRSRVSDSSLGQRVLPGLVQRDLWKRPRGAADRANAAKPAQSVRPGQV